MSEIIYQNLNIHIPYSAPDMRSFSNLLDSLKNKDRGQAIEEETIYVSVWKQLAEPLRTKMTFSSLIQEIIKCNAIHIPAEELEQERRLLAREIGRGEADFEERALLRAKTTHIVAKIAFEQKLDCTDLQVIYQQAFEWLVENNTLMFEAVEAEAFSKLFEQRLHFLWPNENITRLDALAFRVGQQFLFVHNLWRMVRKDLNQLSESCVEQMDSWIQQRKTPLRFPSGPQELASAIRLMIKPKCFLEDYFQHTGKDAVYSPFVGELILVFAMDCGRGLAFVDNDMEDKIHGIELMSAGLGGVLSEIGEQIEVQNQDSLYMAICGGTYEATLLLSDAVTDYVAEQICGELIAAVPTRDVVLFTGSENPEGLLRMRETVSKLFQQNASYLISQQLFVHRNNKWELFEDSSN